MPKLRLVPKRNNVTHLNMFKSCPLNCCNNNDVNQTKCVLGWVERWSDKRRERKSEKKKWSAFGWLVRKVKGKKIRGMINFHHDAYK